MATSTFDRNFIVMSEEDKKRVLEVLNSNEPAAPIHHPPYTQEERDRSVALLKQCLFRSEN